MLKFTKMHGLGNDYVYMDAIHQQIKDKSALAQFVSNRNFGIGSDGLILIGKSNVADFQMEMFNADGSQAQMCGNGIRCVGKFVYDKGLTNKTTITIETLAGIKTLQLHTKEGKVDTVKVDMGEPIFDPKKIPVVAKEQPVKNQLVKANDKVFPFTCVSMGNPHAITVIEDTQNFEVRKYGQIIEVDPVFPEKINVEFVQVVDKNHIKMRVWERGSGETLACGTGACATAVACHINGLTDRKVEVELLGGILEIEWKQDNHVYMTGPAVTVFEGELIEQKKRREDENESN